MSAATSDYDMSDSSNSGASHSTYSPVPQLTADLTELSCADINKQVLQLSNKPFLEIIEQPQDQFRFRYVSELAGTHGCLLGKSSLESNTKTHPTVQLVNYTGKALIRCNLVQHKSPDAHPHKLHDDDHDQDVSHVVPEDGSYIVAFRGIGIVHTKKEVTKKIKDKVKLNLNIVRLKFSAHDIKTNKEICAPVFSDPIYNGKSAATNNLKICRISHSSGSAAGRQDVFMFVEKVNKNHVRVRFFEKDETGKRVWEEFANFMPSDVHHQYGIAFMTPPYRNPKTPVDVTVYMELVRTTDDRVSEPKEFKYKADDLYKQRRRRKMSSSCQPNVPANKLIRVQNPDGVLLNPLTNFNQQMTPVAPEFPEVPSAVGSMYSLHEQLYALSPGQTDVESLLAMSEASLSPLSHQLPLSNPMWSQNDNDHQTSEALIEALCSTNLEVMQNIKIEGLTDSMSEFAAKYLEGYYEAYPGDKGLEAVEFQPSRNIVSDSGRGGYMKFENDNQNEDHLQYQMDYTGIIVKADKNKVLDSSDIEDKEDDILKHCIVEAQMDTEPIVVKADKNTKRMDYNAFYKIEDGIEVKKLVKELCEIIRDKQGFKKQDLRNRLETLFDKRLSNGDTFLHMSLFSDHTCLEYIVKLIHNIKAAHLLDSSNDKLQTTLHLAILHDMPEIVSLLVSKGADPMLRDLRDLNAIHYAVKCGTCLKPLLETIKNHKVVYNINDCNGDKQSALHMAVIEGSADSTRLLLQHGASYSVRDEYGRTPLHLAAYDDNLEVTKALLEFITESDIDVTDNSGNTALQIVCGTAFRTNTVTIAKLLLEKKANPMKTENGSATAWHLVKNKMALKVVLWDYVSAEFRDEDINDDDDFVSADEGESEDHGLQKLSIDNSKAFETLQAGGETSASKRNVFN